MFIPSKCTYLCVFILYVTERSVKILCVNTAIKYLAEGLLIASVQTLICQEISYSSVISLVVVNNQ